MPFSVTVWSGSTFMCQNAHRKTADDFHFRALHPNAPPKKKNLLIKFIWMLFKCHFAKNKMQIENYNHHPIVLHYV
jgi:hypothetical protein